MKQLKSRGLGRNIEFIHGLHKLLENNKNKDFLVITQYPDKIKLELNKYCGVNAVFKPVYEGIRGLRLDDPRRRKGYKPKIIGYNFSLINEQSAI